MTPARLSPKARRDLLSAAAWIAEDSPAAARDFRNSVDLALQRLANYPESGVVRLELTDEPVRFMPMRRFPYVLIYDPNRAPPLVVRILHGARDLAELLRDI